MAVVPAKGPKSCNRVKNCEIWKAHVRKEDKTRRQWESGWDFLVEDYAKLSQQLQAVSDKFAKQTGTNMLVAETSEVSDLSLQPQSHIRSRRHTTEPAREQVQSRQSNTRLPPIDPRQHGHTQHGHTQHSSEQGRHRRTQSVPMKTSAEIGWRSTFPSSLEIYDWPSKPKGDLVKVMKWPREGLPNP